MKTKIREKDIEKKLVAYCKTKNILCYKWTSPANRGVPDRILIGPNGNVAFLELKRPGEEPTELQKHTLKKLYDRKCFAGWADTVEKATKFADNFLAWDTLR